MKSISSQTKDIFRNKDSFEKKVLNVQGDSDRKEIVRILALRLVRGILKEHLNFLYIKEFSDFTPTQIVNIVFREMANEWIDYAMKELNYRKEDALDELRIEDRIKLLKSLSSAYYKQFKNTIFGEIADTFMELLVQNAKVDTKSILINAVINSNLIPNRSVLNINSSNQLSECVKIALKLKANKPEKIEKFHSTLTKVKKSIITSLLEQDA